MISVLSTCCFVAVARRKPLSMYCFAGEEGAVKESFLSGMYYPSQPSSWYQHVVLKGPVGRWAAEPLGLWVGRGAGGPSRWAGGPVGRSHQRRRQTRCGTDRGHCSPETTEHLSSNTDPLPICAFHARKDPDAMEIGQIGHSKGKGKGKYRKEKEGKKGKGKESNGKSKERHSSGKGDKSSESKDRCVICWKAGHATQKCWLNISVSAVTAGDTFSVVSAGPSASQMGGNSSGIISLPPSTQHKRKSVGKIGEHRLLMVKAVQEVQGSIQSAESILAEQERIRNQVKPFWH